MTSPDPIFFLHQFSCEQEKFWRSVKLNTQDSPGNECLLRTTWLQLAATFWNGSPAITLTVNQEKIIDSTHCADWLSPLLFQNKGIL
jgi:hypothetical protein